MVLVSHGVASKSHLRSTYHNAGEWIICLFAFSFKEREFASSLFTLSKMSSMKGTPHKCMLKKKRGWQRGNMRKFKRLMPSLKIKLTNFLGSNTNYYHSLNLAEVM
jgi:hypothetical protein